MQKNFAHDLTDPTTLTVMQKRIKEYSTLKHIMERNADFIKISDESPKYKTVDCQILFTMF